MNNFTFAGFAWPRHVVELPKGRIADRLAKYKAGARDAASVYQHAPEPITGKHPGRGFYLDDVGMPGLRWAYADCVAGSGIRHSGWYTDEFGDGDTIRGIVFRLPRGRGFLYGWTYGEGMSATITGDIVRDEIDAARWADQEAERVAESEREYQARRHAATDLDDKISAVYADLRSLRAEWSRHWSAHLEAAAYQSTKAATTLASAAADLRDEFRRAAEGLRALRAQLPEFADVER